MGRAPAVALAYMWWVKGMPLDDAYTLLFSKRVCHPKLYAIRQATADLLYGSAEQEITIVKRGTGRSKSIKIAGAPLGLEVHCDRCAWLHVSGHRHMRQRAKPAA